MPQLWMTYEELGELFYGNAVTARDHVIANQWERRRCSDGVSRAVVPPNTTLEFMLAYFAKQHGYSDCGQIDAHHDECAASACSIWNEISYRPEGWKLNEAHGIAQLRSLSSS
jgi:hypothetical protein